MKEKKLSTDDGGMPLQRTSRINWKLTHVFDQKKKKKIKLKFVMLESFKIVVEEILVKEIQKNEEKRNS